MSLSCHIVFAAEVDGVSIWNGFTCGALSLIVLISLIVGGMRGYKAFFLSFYTPPNPNEEREKLLADVDGDKKPDIVYKSDKIPEWKILPRDKATRRLLKYLSGQDKWFERKYLCEILEDVYVRLREATERRSVKSVETDLTQEHADELHAQLKAMKKKGHRRVFGKVVVIDINILHVEAAGPKDKHTVTALITAQSKDYVEDDETGKAVEGKKKTYYCQEFWTLCRGPKRWLVELTRPPGDSENILKAKNVLSRVDSEGLAAEAEASVMEHVTARD